MRMTSHGTAGARRRLRHHARDHAELRYSGRSGREYVFEAAADDGRTYRLRLSARDVQALAAGLARIQRSSAYQAAAGLFEGEGETGRRDA